MATKKAAKKSSRKVSIKTSRKKTANSEVLRLKEEIVKLKRKSYVAERLRHDEQKKMANKVASKLASNLASGAKSAASSTFLAAGVAHEFNNILGAIDGHAEWALSRGIKEEMIEALEVARLACERSSQITHALQGLARIREESKDLVEISFILAELERLLKPQAALIHCELKWNLRVPKDTKLYVSSGQILEVLYNLVRNAFDALVACGTAKPVVELSVRKQKSSIVFTVCDNGPGINAAIGEMVFQPFFTTKGVLKNLGSAEMSGELASAPKDNMVAGVKGGSGLGLYLARSIAEEHGGRLELLPPKAGIGACFELLLPYIA